MTNRRSTPDARHAEPVRSTVNLEREVADALTSVPPSSIYFVLGTRPEIIKLAPLARLLGDRVAVIHTGQHFALGLTSAIADDFAFPDPVVQLAIGGKHRGEQIGDAIAALTRHFVETRPAVVVVQGDTNAALAGAVAANAVETKLVHIEAGLRSHDRRMPEEHNRVVIDHLCDLACAPTDLTVENLRRENIEGDVVELTGNTVIEAVQSTVPDEAACHLLKTRLGLVDPFTLVTLHRPENVDDTYRLTAILDALGRVNSRVVFPVHPRTAARMEMLRLPPNVTFIEPSGYRSFLGLMKLATVVLSDSGGVQEEVTVLKKPVVVLRRSTERPEVLGTFAALTADPVEASTLVNALLEDVDRRRALEWLPSPFGDGTASLRCAKAIAERFFSDL